MRAPSWVLVFLLALCGGCKEQEFKYDFDGDGALDEDDCEPDDPRAYPGALEECFDGVDNDCDGFADTEDEEDCGNLWLHLEAGDFHSCGLNIDETIACWACNDPYDYGQCDAPEGLFSRVSPGTAHTCGIDLVGELHCWGCEGEDHWTGMTYDQGQCEPPGGAFVEVDSGWTHACALRDDGEAVCWGNNGAKQCDLPDGTFLEISAGSNHSCGLQEDGSIVCWGCYGMGANQGQCDAPPGEYIDVSASMSVSCAVTVDGDAVCWGEEFIVSTEVPAGDYVQVAAGALFACGLTTAGDVHCWGGHIGAGSLPAGPYAAITTGDNHLWVMREDHTGECVGVGDYRIRELPD